MMPVEAKLRLLLYLARGRPLLDQLALESAKQNPLLVAELVALETVLLMHPVWTVRLSVPPLKNPLDPPIVGQYQRSPHPTAA